MAALPPTPAFARVDLVIAPIEASRTFGRIHRKAFPNPLGFGKNATRFSDPRRRIEANRFGVLYLGSSLKVCFVETIVRDQRDGVVGSVDIVEAEVDDRLFSTLTVSSDLTLIDLCGDAPVQMGIPSDVVRGRTQGLARRWSVAIYSHPARVDGILYPSRLNTEINLAIYDRAVPKLAPLTSTDLQTAPGVGDVLTTFKVALI